VQKSKNTLFIPANLSYGLHLKEWSPPFLSRLLTGLRKKDNFIFSPKAMKYLLILLLSGFFMMAASQKPAYLLVGTYTGGKSKGIHVFRFDANGKAEPLDSAVTPNPSYLAVSPDQQFVYAVNELGAGEGGGKVSAFRFDKATGKLTPLNQQPSQGEHPCYITVDKTGKWVIVGNYSSGTVAVLPILTDGSLGEAVTTVQHQGKGKHLRQEGPHVHQTVLSADNRFLYVPDLGIDKLMIYSFDAQNGELIPVDTTLKLPDGSGPRHFDFHPSQKWGYLLQELSGKVTVFKNKGGRLQPVQSIAVLPAGFAQSFTAADVHVSPDGRFLYTSARDASNTLAIFKINPADGRLMITGHQSTLGKTPRNFNLDPSGAYLLAANQNSDEIVVFHRNQRTGKLTDSGNRIEIGKPVCIRWITP
jgi:6-phosphogluconolactonase